MKNFYSFFFVMVSAIISIDSFSQNTFPSSGAVGIGTTSPAASSLLEVKSTSKGVLFSRMTKNQRDAITSPATGLLIYQTNVTPGFYYYNGTAWKAVTVIDTTLANKTLSNLTSPTKVNVNLLPDNDNKRNLGSSTKGWKNLYLDSAVYLGGSKFIAAPGGGGGNTAVGIGTLFSNTSGFGNTANGSNALSSNTTGGANTAIGYDALYSNTTGLYNSANGYKALYSNTTGLYNSANGFEALYSNTTGYNNSANGFEALYSNTTGSQNTANGYKALYSSTTGVYNSATGFGALFSNTTANENTANGYGALYYNTTGEQNTAIGNQALYFNTTGFYNTANGSYALYLNTTGADNTANGSYALYSNTTGADNTANGSNALSSNTTGYQNTANGYNALSSNTTGNQNTANGFYALSLNATGYQNTANGYNALLYNHGDYNTAVGAYTLSNTTASQYNTAVGYKAGGSYDNGYNNVFLGANTDVNNGNGYYNVIAIGQGTVCTDVSQVTMGNGATATYRAYANWTNISDGRFKKNIKENVPGLEFINKLQPITYTLDATGIDNFLHKDLPQDKQSSEKAKAVMNKALAEKEKVVYTGFVAQDVEKAAKSLNYDFSGVDAAKNNKDLYGLRYAEFVVPLVKAVQELSKKNDSLQNLTVVQQKINVDLQNQINQLKAMIVSNQSTVNGQQSTVISSASLQQNIPNPFTHSTTIGYTLPQKFNAAQIIITDKNGKALKEIKVSGNKGSVNIDASTLASDAYQYSLIVDGRLVDTKQMILTK